MNKEIKAAILGILVLTAFFWTYTKVKRSGVLGRHFTLKMTVDNVYHLRNKQFVMLQGFQVGTVSHQEIASDGSGKYVITLDFSKPLQLPNNTVGQITYISVVGGRQVNLLIDTTRASTGILKDGDMIAGSYYDIPQQIQGALLPMDKKIDAFLLKYPVDSLHQLYEDTKAKIEGFEKTTKSVQQSLAKNDVKIVQTIRNLEQTTQKIRSQTPNYKAQLQTINKTLSELNGQKLDKKIQSATQKIDAVGDSISTKAALISSTNKTIDGVTDKLIKLEKSPTMQKYIYQDSTAKNVKATATKLQTTVRDIYEHPEKYRKVN